MSEGSKTTKVALVKTKDRREGIRKSIELLGINPVQGKNTVLKPNFNTADPYPGSTHPETLGELLKCIDDMGAKSITIAERSGPVDSAEVMEQLGADKIASEHGAGLINIDQLNEEKLNKVDPPGSHWKDGFKVSKLLQEAECIIASPCLKTHQFGGVFTMALKLAVGIVPKAGTNYMPELHSSPHMGKMIAEINYAYHPDLIVLDGIEAFVEEGPMTGKKKNADLFLAGTDRIAVDAVGLAILKELGSTRQIMETPIFEQEQIKRAVELGLGVNNPAHIELLTGDQQSEEYAGKIKEILVHG